MKFLISILPEVGCFKSVCQDWQHQPRIFLHPLTSSVSMRCFILRKQERIKSFRFNSSSNFDLVLYFILSRLYFLYWTSFSNSSLTFNVMIYNEQLPVKEREREGNWTTAVVTTCSLSLFNTWFDVLFFLPLDSLYRCSCWISLQLVPKLCFTSILAVKSCLFVREPLMWVVTERKRKSELDN